MAGSSALSLSREVWSKQNDQGTHECEILEEDNSAAFSELMWKYCSKYPGHPGFIPAPDFGLEHLPERFQDQAILEWIKNYIARTVMLKVSFTSYKRKGSETFPNSLGKTKPHHGSGWISDFKLGEGLCPCSACVDRPCDKKLWWSGSILTAKHVVYDADEARATEIFLFYDDKQSSKPGGKMRRMQGVDMVEFDCRADWCKVQFVTHDATLADELISLVGALKFQSWQLRQLLPDPKLKGKLCVVIAHPHGQPKRVTVGEILRRRNLLKCKTPGLTYTTKTCKGSSGGPVLVLHDDHKLGTSPSSGLDAQRKIWAFWTAPHSRRFGRPLLKQSVSCPETRSLIQKHFLKRSHTESELDNDNLVPATRSLNDSSLNLEFVNNESVKKRMKGADGKDCGEPDSKIRKHDYDPKLNNNDSTLPVPQLKNHDTWAVPNRPSVSKPIVEENSSCGVVELWT